MPRGFVDGVGEHSCNEAVQLVVVTMIAELLFSLRLAHSRCAGNSGWLNGCMENSMRVREIF